ncbi:MAG: GGDEF domain-containing protein [Actinomycetes bacterium]
MEEQVYREIIDQMIEGVYYVDLDRKITFWNPGAESITGYRSDEVVGHSCADGILRHINEHGVQLCVHGCPLLAVMADGQTREANVYLHHKDGHRVPVTVSGHAITDPEGTIVGSVELFHVRPTTLFADTTSRSATEDAFTDPVTGIGNRRYGELNLEPVMSAVANGDTTLGVLFADVDHFKAVNDTFGHRTGDDVLKMVGQNLANALFPSDYPLRWGGEEFMALLPGTTQGTLKRTAERLRLMIEHSWLQRGDDQVRVTVSVGATMARPGESAADVVDRADRLMYTSKSAGRNLVTTDAGTLERSGEIPLVGNSAPWEMDDVQVQR